MRSKKSPTRKKNQKEVVDTLQKILDGQNRVDHRLRASRELNRLIRDQQETSKRTDAIAEKTLGKPLQNLSQDEIAELRVLASRQRDHAQNYARVLAALDQAVRELAERDPAAAETVRRALAETARDDLRVPLDAASENIRQNQIGQASETQRRAMDNLQKLADALAERRSDDLEMTLKKMEEAAAELNQLQKDQTALQSQIESLTSKEDDPERKQALEKNADAHETLKAKTEELARRLERLAAKEAADAAKEAARSMNDAAREAKANEPQEAQKASASSEKSLDEAQKQLDASRRKLEADLAMKKFKKLQDAVRHLRDAQSPLNKETERIDLARLSEGVSARAQAAQLRELTKNQRVVREEARAGADLIHGEGVCGYALKEVADVLNQAGDRLEKRETGTETQSQQRRALELLDMLLESLKQNDPTAEKKDESDKPSEENPDAPANKPDADGIPPIAQIKMLKMMQENLNSRTNRLQEAIRLDDRYRGREQTEYDRLAAEQARLAVLVEEILEKKNTTSPQSPLQQEQPQENPAREGGHE